MPRFSLRHGLIHSTLLLGLTCEALTLRAELAPPTPPTAPPLDSMAAFRPQAAGWQIVGSLGGDPRRQNLITPDLGTGVLLSNPQPGLNQPLVSGWEHADLTLDFDFLLTPQGKLTVWLQGRYPVRFESADVGRIGEGEGQAPLADAGHAAGLWQHARIEFLAPRFDSAGQKVSDARFARVTVNDFLVQNEVAATPAASAILGVTEKAMGSLVWQSERGPVALRKITYRRSGVARVEVGNLGYKLFSGEFNRIGDYGSGEPKAVGVPNRLSQAAVEKSGRYGLVVTGNLKLPQNGTYTFVADAADPLRFAIDDQPVLVPERPGAPVAVTLTAGDHRFQLDYLRATTSGRPGFELGVSQPELGWQVLTTPDSAVPARPPAPTLKIDPTDRVLVQRGFVPFEPRKRVYAISVGTPQRVHFAYDLETTALLRVWRGRFLDAGEMWINRGENQYAKSNGPGLTFTGLPSVALIEYPLSSGWPDRPDPLMTPQGYTLEPNGQPVFLTKLTDVLMKDRLAPSADGRGLARRLDFSGGLPSWQVAVLLADAEVITAQPDGGGWIVGDRGYYIDWPKNSPYQPAVRTRGGRQLLVVPLSKNLLGQPLNYELVW